MEHQHWSYNTDASRKIHTARHQKVQDELAAIRVSAPKSRPAHPLRTKVLMLLLIGILLLFTLAQVAPIPAASALPTAEHTPPQMEKVPTSAYQGGGGCSGGRGVQTTRKADC